MRKVVFYVSAICFLFNLSIFVSAIAQEKVKLTTDTYTGPTVTIFGRITYPAFKEGQLIMVNAKSSPAVGPPDIASVNVAQPGEYSFKAPQNIGDVYISAVVLEPGQLFPSGGNIAGFYSNNPLEIRSSNIKNINIELGKKSAMETYKGATVTISGRIAFPAFKEGQLIMVNAKSSPAVGPPRIASVKIAQPGEYSLKVPQNIGDVYISAVVLEPDEFLPSKDSLRQTYDKGRSIKVGSSDISGIDMAIQ